MPGSIFRPLRQSLTTLSSLARDLVHLGRVEDWRRCSVGPAYPLLPVSVGVGIELGRANGEVEGSHSRAFGCEMAAHFHQRHVFRGPPIMPDGGISPVRFEVLAFPLEAFPSSPRFKRWFAYTLTPWFAHSSSPRQRPATAPVLSSRPPTLTGNRQVPRVPLPTVGVTSYRET